MDANPFDSIESARDYVRLLRDQVDDVAREISQDLRRASAEGAFRRAQALQLVDYKLNQLKTHLGVSGRLLNDLRILRRLLLEERPHEAATAPVRSVAALDS
jgi:hypothetical protein